MCINIALPKNVRVVNQGQKLAGTGIFVSDTKGTSKHDDPVSLNLCRLHFEDRHNGNWGEIPQHFSVAIPRSFEDCTQKEEEDEILAYRQAIMSDTAVGRGYWKSTQKKNFHIPTNEGCHKLPKDWMKYCTEGKWALILDPSYREENLQKGEALSLGDWYKDGQGCYLSYAIPVGAPIELMGEGFCPGPSGFIYQVGSMQVNIPLETEWAVWVRCSDTEIHAGFTIIRLFWHWSENREKVWIAQYPVLASLFKAPHDFPTHGYFFDPKPSEIPDFGSDLHAAVRLAEHIAEHGFTVPKPQPPKEHIYDALAAEHVTGRLGVFGVK